MGAQGDSLSLRLHGARNLTLSFAFYGDRAVGTIGEGLQTCWQRIRPVKLERLDCRCEYVEACRGGCRYRAELLDNPQGRDLYRCSLYGVIDKAE